MNDDLVDGYEDDADGFIIARSEDDEPQPIELGSLIDDGQNLYIVIGFWPDGTPMTMEVSRPKK